MILNERIAAFSALGLFMSQFKTSEYKQIETVLDAENFFTSFQNKIQSASHHNGWFTAQNVLFAIAQWSQALTEQKLTAWMAPYATVVDNPKTVGIVMAGNIPLVGFHDFIAVLLMGHRALIKRSSKDAQLLPMLSEYLINQHPEFKNRITFTTEKMSDYDAIIATGSTNTARYFEYYFANKPNIIRKNRNSVAILTGQESPEELTALGTDIFQYYGLGCRSVSKLWVPRGYDFDLFFKAIYAFHPIMDSAKYANNYDYNKAVYLMSEFKLLDNGFLILKEDASYSSPIASLCYEYYDSEKQVQEQLHQDHEQVQCIVGNHFEGATTRFGATQYPKLTDYADGIDILQFLLKIQ